MRKVLMLAVAMMLAAAPAFAQDKKPADKPAAPKTMSVTGAVTAVAADSLAVKSKTGDLTFAGTGPEIPDPGCKDHAIRRLSGPVSGRIATTIHGVGEVAVEGDGSATAPVAVYSEQVY